MLIAFYPSSVLLSIPLNAYITVFLSIFFSDGHWHCLGVSEVAQSCPILCDPMDCSLPCSSVHGILQARYWSGLPFPSPGDLPDPGIKPGSPALEADALTSEPPGKPHSHSVQFSSVAQSCPTLCDPMNRSTPGLPVRHQLPEFTQTRVHRVSDAIQPSHPLLSPSPAHKISH